MIDEELSKKLSELGLTLDYSLKKLKCAIEQAEELGRPDWVLKGVKELLEIHETKKGKHQQGQLQAYAAMSFLDEAEKNAQGEIEEGSYEVEGE